jgi:hypothetical protein
MARLHEKYSFDIPLHRIARQMPEDFARIGMWSVVKGQQEAQGQGGIGPWAYVGKSLARR